MTELSEIIRQAVVDAYWKQPYPHTMAIAAVNAVRVKNADLKKLAAIIDRYLAGPDFAAMSVKLAEAFEINFTINGQRFKLAPHGGGWRWQNDSSESLTFVGAWQAQEDAIRHAKKTTRNATTS